MRIFRTESEAKEFLIHRIAEQARRDGEPLTDLERRMLYFSETGWTLPGMAETNTEFERVCDEAAYERKILALALNAQADDRAAGGDASADWHAAVDFLSGSDHYIQVLIDPRLAAPPQPRKPSPHLRRILLAASAVVAVGLVVDLLVAAVRHHP